MCHFFNLLCFIWNYILYTIIYNVSTIIFNNSVFFLQINSAQKRKRNAEESVESLAKQQKNEHIIFVTQLSSKSTKESIEVAFSKFGLINNINFRYRTGKKSLKHTGYCFISFKDGESTEDAIKESNTMEVSYNFHCTYIICF